MPLAPGSPTNPSSRPDGTVSPVFAGTASVTDVSIDDPATSPTNFMNCRRCTAAPLNARRFTVAEVREHAIGIVDRDGLGALSMRSLATALGTGPMMLYNYVNDRDELEVLIA